MPNIRAGDGVDQSLVGQKPDERSEFARQGERGIMTVQDSPYRQNQMTPGTPKDLPNQGLVFGSDDTYDMFAADADEFGTQEGAQVEQAQGGMLGDPNTGGLPRGGWLNLGRDCYEAAHDHYVASAMSDHVAATFMFKSKHLPGSKYHHPAYKNRSKIFRPATRMAARSWEADVASALFLNDDYMHITARNVGDEGSEMGAAVIKEVMNLRLDNMWYPICIGGAQDAFTNGPVISKVYWQYEVAMKQYDKPILDEMGQLIGIESVTEPRVVQDRPRIDLVLPENFLYDPLADWADVIGTSNYFVHRKRMSVSDVQSKTRMGEWFAMSQGQLLTCTWNSSDSSVEQAKRADRQAPEQADDAAREYESVEVCEVFVKRDGIWYVYHMLGTEYMLEDPVELSVRYAHGRIPFAYGTAMIESHNTSPDSKATVGRELQDALNSTTNQRMDNVALAMNKRYLARRGATVDVESLTRSAPGGVTWTGNPETDVKELAVTDVTSSAYEESQRITMEMNELQGTFSGQAVANNNNMNETVGGLKLLSNAASKVNDYDIRTFVMTWVRPTLELFMLTEQYYENDQTILMLASKNAAGFPRLKAEDLSDDLMTKQLALQVDVGLGATDPVQRVNTIIFGVERVMGLPGMAEAVDSKAVSSAIFAALGHGDGSNFFPSLGKNFQEPPAEEAQPDPIVQAAQIEAEGLVQAEQVKADLAMQMKQMELASKEKIELLKMALGSENHGKDIQLATVLALLDNDTRLRIAGQTDKTKRDTTALQHSGGINQSVMNQAAGIAQSVTPTQQVINESAQSEI